MGFTMRQYNKVWEETQLLLRMDSDEEIEEPMSGDLGAAAASRLLPRKETVYG